MRYYELIMLSLILVFSISCKSENEYIEEIVDVANVYNQSFPDKVRVYSRWRFGQSYIICALDSCDIYSIMGPVYGKEKGEYSLRLMNNEYYDWPDEKNLIPLFNRMENLHIYDIRKERNNVILFSGLNRNRYLLFFSNDLPEDSLKNSLYRLYDESYSNDCIIINEGYRESVVWLVFQYRSSPKYRGF